MNETTQWAAAKVAETAFALEARKLATKDAAMLNVLATKARVAFEHATLNQDQDQGEGVEADVDHAFAAGVLIEAVAAVRAVGVEIQDVLAEGLAATAATLYERNGVTLDDDDACHGYATTAVMYGHAALSAAKEVGRRAYLEGWNHAATTAATRALIRALRKAQAAVVAPGE